MINLTDLPNISKVIASDLEKVGISTVEELKRIGSRDAFVRIRLYSDNDACLKFSIFAISQQLFTGGKIDRQGGFCYHSSEII